MPGARPGVTRGKGERVLQNHRTPRRAADAEHAAPERRMPPSGMPAHTPPQKGDALRGAKKPVDVLPAQKPVTDDEAAEKKPARWKITLVRVLTGVLIVAALALCFVFLLLGEPDEEAKLATETVEESIRMPMNALESPGETIVQNLADTFGQPVLALYGGGLAMQKARVFDTAFSGGYARRVTLTYAFSDGSVLTTESIRPTSAAKLLGGPNYKLHASSLYGLGGVDAARMDSPQQICVFGQSDTAVYAVICPTTHAEELSDILKQTTLVVPAVVE